MLTCVSLIKWGVCPLVNGKYEGDPEPISLLCFLWSIKCTPEKWDDAQGSDTDPTATETEDTSDLTNELSSAKSSQSTPQYLKQREEFERRVPQLAKQDLKRNLASQMFTVIEPSSEPNIWLLALYCSQEVHCGCHSSTE